MAFAITHFFPNGTNEQYDASLEKVHPGGRLPDGQIFHVAGMTQGGFIIFAVHESRESWETFRDTVLMPAMQAGIEGGFQGPPEEREIEVHQLQQAEPATA
jgi:hypothetical protein